jgi:hypothetical protein
MLSNRNSRLRRLLGPLSKRISRTAQSISQSPSQVLRLLFSSWSAPRIQSQPDVYPLAAYLGERFDCTHVITMDRPSPRDLIHLYPRFEIIGIVPGADSHSYSDKYGFGTWLDESAALAVALPPMVLKRAIIICKDLDQFDDAESLLSNLKLLLDQAPVCILTSGDKLLNQTSESPSHTDKWNLIELEQLLKSKGFRVEFTGWTASDNVSHEKNVAIAVITNANAKQISETAPGDFRVVAFMAAYNEEDIIVQSIKKWTDQGISVHVLENWSTDATYELAKDLEDHLPVTVERFPATGPSQYFDWGAMLKRMEQLSREIEADWFVRRGADEVLTSPWPGVSYRDALYLVDQAGFNCIDHTIIEFYPVDDEFEAGADHEAYFKHFDFKNLSHSNQRKAWKNHRQPISSIASAGHDVLFEGRRVYPFKFLLKHYSFRSQKHGEKKVFRERKARWNPEERARGWHIHYDAMQEGHRFVESPSEKMVFDEDHFHKTYLVERLSGVGVNRKKSN